MAYDEHYANKDHGPIASQSWYEERLSKRMGELDPAKTIIALGNYGYDWAKDRTRTKLVFRKP
jgi:spore germination protein YaaH